MVLSVMMVIIVVRGNRLAVLSRVDTGITGVAEHYLPLAVRRRDTHFMAPVKCRHRLNGRRN